MSMTFIYKDVLYADHFQVLDFKYCHPAITDKKIYVSKSKKTVIAIMDKVPEDPQAFVEQIETNLIIYDKAPKKTKEAHREASDLVRKSIAVHDIVFLGNYKGRNLAFNILFNDDVYFLDKDSVIKPFFGCSDSIYPMLDFGMTPAEIFKGYSLTKGTISEKYTAFDLQTRKFIQN